MITALTSARRAMLSLLSYELFRLAPKAEDGTDWADVLREGERHAVSALLYTGMKKIGSVPENLLDAVCETAATSSQMSEYMLDQQHKIIDLLEKAHIPCAILKGTSVACLYPHPELRVPGDIDILTDENRVEEACTLLTSAGFAFTHDAQKHCCFEKQGVSVEVHRMVAVFPDTEKGKFAAQFMQQALHNTASVRLGGFSFPVLTGKYQLIALLAHMEQHLTSGGIGLRQLCDWAVTVNTLRSEIDDGMTALWAQCGLLNFAQIVTKICEEYLGLPAFSWTADADEALADALMQDILEGGNFRSQDSQRPFGGVLTDAYNVDNSAKTSTLHSYFQYIRKRIGYDYPWAKGPFWLLVFGIFYPARWTVRMLLGKRKKFSVKQALSSARKREKLLRQLNLYK